MQEISTRLEDYSSLPSNIYGADLIAPEIFSLLKVCNYLSQEDLTILTYTCHYAAVAHDGQKRKSGEPYIVHPIKVAEILASLVRFDLKVLQAGLLHDVLEDCEAYTAEIMIATFGEEVTLLVDGVSKFERLSDTSRESQQAKTFAKMVVAMEKDPRVIMIKLADRMHNLQTLGAVPMHKRVRVIEETLSVYVPIAERLGMYQFKTALEELAFKNKHSWRYKTIVKMLVADNDREELLNEVREKIISLLEKKSLSVEVYLRERNVVNAYKKFKKNLKAGRELNKASLPFIIIADSIEDCYQILSIVHSLYKPINHRLNDYIAVPKVNGYQSLHTSVIINKCIVANFQIRTRKMHNVAEHGIVALYREQLISSNESLTYKQPEKPIERFISSMRSLQVAMPNPEDYYKAVKDDLAGDRIQVLTPKGEPLSLPVSATPIDFAYKLHSKLGDLVTGARVNDIKVPLDYILSNEQTVELVTDKHAAPKVEWFQFVRSSQARGAIRFYFKSLSTAERVNAGKQFLLDFFKSSDIVLEDPDNKLGLISDKFTKSVSELYEKVALGDVDIVAVFNAMKELGQKHTFVYKVSIRIDNRPKMLAQVVNIIGDLDINIEHIDSVTGFFKTKITFNFILSFDELSQLFKAEKKLNNIPFVNYVKIDEVKND